MVANKQWVEMFNSYKVEVLPARTLNHRPLLITAETTNPTRIRGSKNLK